MARKNLLRLKPILTLPEAAAAWGVTSEDIFCCALDESVTLSTIVHSVRVETGEYIEVDTDEWQSVSHGSRYLSGVHDVYGLDIWPAASAGCTKIRRFKPKLRNNFINVEEEDGVVVEVGNIVIRKEEFIRFGEVNGLGETEDTEEARATKAGPGAPPKYDWDGFWIMICCSIHECGVPSTQSLLIQRSLNWYSESHDAVPDESTVKKKISRLWRELKAKS